MTLYRYNFFVSTMRISDKNRFCFPSAPYVYHHHSSCDAPSVITLLLIRYQDIQSLELKLGQARTLLDSELSLRRRVEQERDRLLQQLQFLRQIVLDDNVIG